MMACLRSGFTSNSPSPPRPVAFCVTDLDPGGAERALVRIVTGLDRSRWTPAVFCLGPEGKLADELRQAGIDVFCYGATRAWNLGVIPWLTRHLRAFRPELLQGVLFHGNLAGRIAGRRAGVPVIVSGHRVAEREKRWHLWLDRWTGRWVDHHVCVSQGVAEHVRRHLQLRAEQVTVIPNGVALPAATRAAATVRAEWGIAECELLVLAIGRLHRQKGFATLIDAFAAMRPRLPGPARLLIVGDGPERGRLERRIRVHGLGESVHLAGRRDDVPDLLRAADLFVLSSLWEGMPNALLEAMAAGVPVVSTRVEGIEELLANSGCGLVVTPGSANELSSAMHRLLTGPDLAAETASRAQLFVKENFTWERSVQDYASLYDRLLVENRSTSEHANPPSTSSPSE
jgi:glycosyltransferase involved in cell wall biosynthesis